MGIIADWVKCRDVMLPAIEKTNGTHNEEAVVAQIMTGKLKLWLTENSAALTEFIDYPLMKVLNVFLVGGEPQLALVELRALEPRLIEFAKQAGCKRITGGGRDGWERVPSDWHRMGPMMYKDLTP